MKNEKLKFTCPECGKHVLEREEIGVGVFREILDLNTTKKFNYDVPRFPFKTSLDCTSFSCKKCSFIVEDEKGAVDNPKRLVRWIKKNCPQE